MRRRVLQILFIAALSGCSGAPAAITTPAAADETEVDAEPPATSPGAAGCLTPLPQDPCATVGVAAPALTEAEAEQRWSSALTSRSLGRWAECGDQLVLLARRHPDRARRSEAIALALRCLDRRREQIAREGDPLARVSRQPDRRASRGSERFEPRELTEPERERSNALDQLLCSDLEGDDALTIAYQRARLRYDANQWEAAAVLFRQLVDQHPEAPLAATSANLYFDCLNVLARLHPERRERCQAALAADVEAFLAIEPLTRDEVLQDQLNQLRVEIRWSRAESLREAESFSEAAEALLALYREHRGGDRAGRHGLDELLHNAAIDFEAACQIGKALGVRRHLESRFGPDSASTVQNGWISEPARRSIFIAAGDLHALGEHRAAAEAYERFVRFSAAEEDAPDALWLATGLRLGLGDRQEAMADTQLFERNYARSHRLKGRTASLALLVARAALPGGDLEGAEGQLESALRRNGGVASPDERILAEIALGEARWRRGGAHLTGAREALTRAVALADADAPQGQEAAEARLARLRGLIRPHQGDGDVNEVEGRLVLLLEGLAGARERLGLPSPERALLRAQPLTPDEARRRDLYHQLAADDLLGCEIDRSPLDPSALGEE